MKNNTDQYIDGKKEEIYSMRHEIYDWYRSGRISEQQYRYFMALSTLCLIFGEGKRACREIFGSRNLDG